MNTKLKTFGLLLLVTTIVKGQDEQEQESGLQISGSVDTYYKYDFSGNANQPTWFGNDQNSVSLGMANLILTQSKDKVTFVADVALGPRANQIYVNDGAAEVDGSSTAPGLIQNLYVSYSLSENIDVTAGFMGTFIGYEVISPTANFNYTGSYLFSNGPFQNAGIKADISLGEKIGLMVGGFSSSWDSYVANPELGMDNIGTQLSYNPVEGLDIYLNYISGAMYEQWDVTSGYQVSDPLYLGLNVSGNSKYAGDESGFFGAAGYAQFSIGDAASIGLRYEHFTDFEGFDLNGDASVLEDVTRSSFTLSANITDGPLTFIPEFRFDLSDQQEFLGANDAATDSFSQILFAAVYSF